MPLIDRAEYWKTWVASPPDIVNVVKRAVDELAEHLRTTVSGATPAVGVAMYFAGRTITQASLDDFLALHPPDLRQIIRVDILIGTAVVGGDSLTHPRITLTLQRSDKAALSVSVVGSHATFVEGTIARLKEDLSKIQIRRGPLIEVIRWSIVATFAVPLYLYMLLSDHPEPLQPYQWVARVLLFAPLAGFAGYACGAPIAHVVLPKLSVLELVPSGTRDQYSSYKTWLAGALGLLATLWALATAVWPGIKWFLRLL